MASTKRRKIEDRDANQDRPRKKKKKSSGMGMLLIGLGAAGAFLVLLVIVGVTLWLVFRKPSVQPFPQGEPAPQAQKKPLGTPAPGEKIDARVSRANFNRLKEGMSLSQVESVLGPCPRKAGAMAFWEKYPAEPGRTRVTMFFNNDRSSTMVFVSIEE